MRMTFFSKLGVASLALAAPFSFTPHASAAQSTAQQAEAHLTLRGWEALEGAERRIVIVAGIEGLMLAATDGDEGTRLIDRVCLASNSPEEIEQALLQLVPDLGDQPYLDVMLGLTGCIHFEGEAS